MADDKSPKAGDLVTTVERFFLDIIGSIIPGGLLIAGWTLLFGVPAMPGKWPSSFSHGLDWALVALAYVLGHFISSIGQKLTKIGSSINAALTRSSKSTGEPDPITTSPTYVAFLRRAVDRWPSYATIPAGELHDWRNIAMSLLTPDQNHTVYRFMFISLMSLGVGTVVVLLAAAWLIAKWALSFSFLQPWGSSLFPQVPALDLGVLALAVITAYFFFDRRAEFYSRAVRTPFSIALVNLEMQKEKTETSATAPQSLRKRTIYLAGGMRSDWQAKVIAELPDWDVVDPRSHHLADERQYTYWDLQGVRKSDWVLAFLEASNPGGYNLAVEVGFAKALGRKIVLVDEKSSADSTVQKYTGMLRVCADVTPKTLDDALTFLKRVSSLE
ncbi:MAG: hypothetical protein J0H49_02920 [Acidobacteria bacterium]|nr:hypothetical protein [Acidobacteriota bacterium]